MDALFLQIVPAILCAVLDYIIHWHIDYSKHKVNKLFHTKIDHIFGGGQM